MEFLNITATSWSSLLSALSITVLSLMMFVLGKTRMHYLWGVFNAAVALWVGAFYMVTMSTTSETALWWWKVSYLGVILIPFTFYHFVLEFVNISKLNAYKYTKLILLYGVAGVFIVFDLNSNAIIEGVQFLFGEFFYGRPGYLHPYFSALYILIVGYSFSILFRSYRLRANDTLFLKQTTYLITALIIAFTGGSLNFLPIYGIESPPISNAAVVLGAALAAYATLRYRLLNVRIVTAQFLTLFLVVFSLIQLVLSSSREEVIFNVAVLSFMLFVGIYLILSVKREVEQREQIEKLAKDLKAANERLRELDVLKSQFLSIASHDLRAPLTAIRNFMSLLLDGTFGQLPAGAKEGTQQVFDRATDMASMVDNYLNVSRIEQGKMKYDFTDTNLSELVTSSVQAFTSVAKEKGLTLSLAPIKDQLTLKGDASKLREIIENLINNGVLYTPQGSITVSLERKGGVARLVFKDTGVGMTKETIAKLFKLFSPGDDSRKYNPKSTGVGLYITKAHVEAHRGKVWAESEGPGKGSTFIVELPLT